MRQALNLHPDSRCDAVTGIEVEAVRSRPANLLLRYFVTGKMADLRMPAASAPTGADELWRHTCFEAFLGVPKRAFYFEFNFAPSGEWAAYLFRFYRDKNRVLAEPGTPHIATQSSEIRYEMEVALALDRQPELVAGTPWHLGLSAVIEESSGRISYWALKHPPGKPDFHHSDCFALEVPAA